LRALAKAVAKKRKGTAPKRKPEDAWIP
jgi:hypothetical protein